MNHRLINISLVLSALYIVFSVVYFVIGYPIRGVIVLASIIPAGFLAFRIATARKFVDNQISRIVGYPEDYSVFTRTLPGYRFVDVFRAAEVYAQSLGAERFETQHPENLVQVITGEFYAEANRHTRPPEYKSKAVAEDEEGFFPNDCFWLVRRTLGSDCGVIRVRTIDYSNEVLIEIAAKSTHQANIAVTTILENAAKNSIYKNKIIEISFQQEIRDEYGGIELREKVDPIFLTLPPVTSIDIVLDDETRDILQRTVIDFHERRDELVKLGLPARHGVLFYGPPGTGKTFTSRFLSNELGSATTIVSSGNSLLHVRSVCNIGRMLQPSVIVLEDVDLVYSQRETNAYSTALGELMDVLDGFRADDQIIFILTTNSIERVEDAIKERPGRISQCIYFGPPNGDLRARYLSSLVAAFNTSVLDVGSVVEKTDGATHAFLKELVFRAVQIGSEKLRVETPDELPLTNSHFDAALTEMRKSAGNAGEAIIGFQAKR